MNEKLYGKNICECLNYVRNRENYITSEFQIKKKKYDFSYTYDSAIIVSKKFKDFCENEKLKGIEFYQLKKQKDFYLFKVNQILEFDSQRRKTEFIEYNESCGEFNEVVGAFPVCLKSNEKMKNNIFITIFCSIGIFAYSQSSKKIIKEMNEKKKYPKSLANYNDFKNLVSELESYREERLIELEEFLKMSQKENTIVLDTRSTFRYNRKHLKGAIHLSFTDFTQQALWELIPDPNTKILIYCNNNFDGDQIDFMSKISIPRENKNIETQILSNRKPIMLALNIPTYINLYGYGYRNIYELDELVNVNDSRIEFEGTEVKTTTNTIYKK